MAVVVMVLCVVGTKKKKRKNIACGTPITIDGCCVC